MSMKEYNTLQVQLIKSSGLIPGLWIEKFAKRFCELVNDGELVNIETKLYN